MTELGREAPPFALPNVLTGQAVRLGDFEGRKALLVMFICKHCPYVLHVKPALIQLATDYADQPLGIVSISSNDAERYPDDAPERIAEMALELPFPILYDETQEVAKAYRAACTPDFFLFDVHRLFAVNLRGSDQAKSKFISGDDRTSAHAVASYRGIELPLA